MELFDFIGTLFDQQKYATVPDSVKKKWFFMVQRFVSIKYPLEADHFNKNGINQVVVMDFWASFLSRSYTRQPKWLFTKANSKKADITDKTQVAIGKIKTTTVDYYLHVKKMDRRDFEFLKSIEPEYVLGQLKMLESAIKEDNLL